MVQICVLFSGVISFLIWGAFLKGWLSLFISVSVSLIHTHVRAHTHTHTHSHLFINTSPVVDVLETSTCEVMEVTQNWWPFPYPLHHTHINKFCVQLLSDIITLQTESSWQMCLKKSEEDSDADKIKHPSEKSKSNTHFLVFWSTTHLGSL